MTALACAGLLMVIIAGAELYTGNTALVTAAVVEGKATMSGLVKNWTTSYVGNLVGSLLLAFLVSQAGLLTATGPAAKAAAAKTSLAFVPVRSLRP